MVRVHQNPSPEHLKPDKDRETIVVINPIIGKAQHQNLQTEISKHASIATVKNTQVRSAGIFIRSSPKNGLLRSIQQMKRAKQRSEK